jgi:hypothetical protein
VGLGWHEKQRRTHDVTPHFRPGANGKIYAEKDGTDAEIVRELLRAGVSQEDIARTFRSPQPFSLN